MNSHLKILHVFFFLFDSCPDYIRTLFFFLFWFMTIIEMASSGSEKDLYFYCQRDRKYRNSTRPNRVTKAGFWKATGTDRPIYSSKGNCIGLKKSLVFYRGRAAKGIKTEWMMHEFRLPSLSDSSLPRNLPLKALPPSVRFSSSYICYIILLIIYTLLKIVMIPYYLKLYFSSFFASLKL